MRRWSGRSKRRAYVLLASAAAAGLVAASAGASEITSTWSGNSGDWTDATQWSTNPNYPNNGTPSGVNYDALINAPGTGAYTVSLSSSITVDSVTLSSPNATLLQTDGTLTMTSLNIFSGTCTSSGADLLARNYLNSGGTLTISNEFAGLGSSSFDNIGGTIDAGANSTINVSLPGNNTTAQLGNLVTNGGAIKLDGGATGLIDNTGQTLTFGGSAGSVLIADTTINNGVVNLPPAAVLYDVTLSNVTLASDVRGDEHLDIQGINAAGHTLNIGSPSGFCTLAVLPDIMTDSSVTLSNVTVNLGGGIPLNKGYVFATANAPINLTIDPSVIVSGAGGVGFTFGVQPDHLVTNQGVIAANIAGQTLQVANAQAEFGSVLTNTGTLQAANGGILDVDPSFISAFDGWTNNGSLMIDDISSIQVNQGLTLATGSALNLSLGNNGSSGLLSIDGGINIQNGAALNLALDPGTSFTGPYEIATYTAGDLLGAFSQVTPGFVVDYSRPGEILVTAIPEPASVGIGAVVVVYTLTGRHRRRRRV